MFLRAWLIFLLCGVASCASAGDELAKAYVTGLFQFGEVAAASAEFRQEHGRWPAGPMELQPLITDPKLNMKNLENAVIFKPGPRGLAFVDRQSGQTVIVVTNESTPEHVVLTGG